MILLDTDTLTHFAYGNRNVQQRIEAAADEELAVSVVTRIEILRGRGESLLKAANAVELRTAIERYRQSEELLAAFVVVSFDEQAITHFERLRKLKPLKKMGRADMLIASITLARDALLVTRNVRDYTSVPGLRVDNWVD